MELNGKPVIRASIIVIMLFQIAALIARSFLQTNLLESGFDATVAKHLSYLSVPVVLLLLMWPILLKNSKALLRMFRRPVSWPKLIFASVALGVLLRLAWWLMLFAVGSFGWLDTAKPGSGIEFSYYFACPPTDILLLSIFVMAILTPIEEEIVHRGLILGALSNRDNRIAIGFSALFFAILHVPTTMPYAFIIGIFLAAQFLRYRTLWATIVTHATYNFLTILDWDCLHGMWLPEEPTSTTVLSGGIALFVGMACLAVAAWIVGFVRVGAD